LRKRKNKMEVTLGEAPSSLPKEEDEVEVVQLVGVVLQCPPARWMGFNGGGDGGAPP